MKPLQIREDDLTGQAIANLIQEHLNLMCEVTPAATMYSLDLGSLRSPEITFWSAWQNNTLYGCGALKAIDASSGEIKSMHTAKAYRRQGIATTMLEHIIHQAQRRNYTQLYLETGAIPAFAPARALYERHGFEYRGPFGEYRDDPDSAFMVKQIG